MRAIPREVSSAVNKELFQLSEIQEQVLVGTLLGDGGIQFRGRQCRLHIKHAAKQMSLVEYKREVFENIISMHIREFTQTVGKKDYNFAEFVTLTHPEFTRYRELFYPSNRKIVPENIRNMLVNPLSVAVWFMDDGSAEYAGASLQTHSFSADGVDKLLDALRANFSLEGRRRLNKGKWVIYFPKSSMCQLEKLLKGYILPDFYYKLIPYSTR